MRVDGVDISAAQTITDSVAIPTLRFMAIQVGASWEGNRADGENRINSKLAAQKAVARARGFPIIWYFVPVGPNGGSLESQWQKWLAAIGSLGPNDGFMFDLEYPHARQWGRPALNALMDRARSYLGRPVFDYDYVDGLRQSPSWTVKWAAYYGTTPGSEAMRPLMLDRYSGVNVSMWQWAGSTGRVPGFVGAVDCNEILNESAFKGALGMATGPTMNPKAKPKLLTTWDVKNGAKRRSIVPRVIVLHTNAAGSAVSIESNWSHANAGGTQAHFQVQGGWHADGTVGAYQFLPTDREGVGSWNGDPFAITIETQDNGATPIEKLRTTPWTAVQVEAIAQVCAVECKRWNIPVRVCNAWNGAGIGWHRQWGVNTKSVTSKGQGLPLGSLPGYVNPWTMTSGKTCPENARIAQVPQIVARVAQIIAGTTPPDVPTTEAKNVSYFMDRSVPDPKPVYEIVAGAKLHVVPERIPELVAVFGTDWVSKVPTIAPVYLASLPVYTPGGTGPQGPPGPAGPQGPPGGVAAGTYLLTPV